MSTAKSLKLSNLLRQTLKSNGKKDDDFVFQISAVDEVSVGVWKYSLFGDYLSALSRFLSTTSHNVPN